MRVRVVAVTRAGQGGGTVTLRSDLGAVSARWAGTTRAPVEGAEYHVELDLDLVLDRATNTRVVEAAAPALHDDGERVVVQAIVEAVADDGVAYLRLAPDALVMVETTGGFMAGDHVRVTAPAGAVTVTPFDI